MFENNQIMNQENKLIDFSNIIDNPMKKLLWKVIEKPVEKTLSIKDINRFYNTISYSATGADFFKCCLDTLNIRYMVTEKDLNKIPKKGPLIVVSNHPFGGLDGVILGAIMASARPDVKIMGNYLLHHITQLKDIVIPLDPFGSKSAAKSNLKGMKDSIMWLKNGGALVMFPAGEVSSLNIKTGKIADPDWSRHVSSLIRHTKATTLPVHFSGRNSSFFQLMGLIHPRIRTILLPREIINKCDSDFKVYIGKPIPWNKLERFESDDEITKYLRISSYFLKNRQEKKYFVHKNLKFPTLTLPLPISHFKKAGQEEIIAPIPTELLKKDIAGLREDQLLAEAGDLSVYVAQAHQLPNMLQEIGRLRELTFREVQEGTNLSKDLDKFDAYYLHLFLWNTKDETLVGAYRLGLTDEIISKYGVDGLYTSTLFRYKKGFIDQLGTAIEIGRSFIRSEYQKKYNSLLLLWKGIGQFIVRNPKYNSLFGAVSISKDYHMVSKNLIVHFLKQNKFDTELSRYVRAKNPYHAKKLKYIDKHDLSTSMKDIDDISVLISEIEKDGKGIPILLRHYLKLNASLISFNVDKNFSSVVDGLILVDLNKTDGKLLERFTGKKDLTLG